MGKRFFGATVCLACSPPRKLRGRWLNGATLEYRCRRHPDTEPMTVHADGRMERGFRVSMMLAHVKPRPPLELSPAPGRYPRTHPDDPEEGVKAVCLTCLRHGRVQDGGYRHEFVCPIHGKETMKVIASKDKRTVWMGRGWDKTPPRNRPKSPPIPLGKIEADRKG